MGKSGNQGPWGGGGNRPSGGHRPENNDNQPDIEELIRKSQEKFKDVLGGGNNGNKNDAGIKPFVIIAIGLLLFWCSTGFYRVDADEQGIVLRFGKFHRVTEPGLNYHLPYPIEMVETPRITSINREEIGFRSVGGGYNKKENRRIVPEESLMLTGDKNLVSTQFEVQWRINDAVKFMFNLRNPANMVHPAAETAMREVMGNTTLSMAISDKRQAMGEETKVLMQDIMDKYGTGIEIYEVNLLAVDAPEPVVDAFIDVLAAQQEKETLQNKAKKYRDGMIPVAQGQAEKMIKDAQAYKLAVVDNAKGDAARFNSIYKEYKLAKEVTQKRMYLETMEKIMPGMKKVILDGKAGQNVMPYLPLPEIQKRSIAK